MNIEKFVNKSNFSELEKQKVIAIDEKLQSKSVCFSFRYDEEISHSKCNITNKEILINPNEDRYVSLIHELLHAKLVFCDGFPDWDDLPQFSDSINNFLKKMRIDLINDLQHFIFYEEWNELTATSNNRLFVQSEEVIFHSNIRDMQNELKLGCQNLRVKTDILKAFYYGFITLKYRDLLKDSIFKPDSFNGTFDDYEFIKENYSPDILNEFETLFNVLTQKTINSELIIITYKSFISNIEMHLA